MDREETSYEWADLADSVSVTCGNDALHDRTHLVRAESSLSTDGITLKRGVCKLRTTAHVADDMGGCASNVD